MFTTAYWKSLLERAVVVFCGALAGILGGAEVGLLDAPWQTSLSLAGMATLVAVLMSIAGGRFTTSPGPTLTSSRTEKALNKK